MKRYIPGKSLEEAQVYPVCNYCLMPVVAREWDDHLMQFHPNTKQAREIYAYEPDWYQVLRRQHGPGEKPPESSLLRDWLQMKLRGLSGEEAAKENERLIQEWEERHPIQHVPVQEETQDHEEEYERT